MYYQFFGLKKEPFGMTPDPSFLFLTAAHREALAGLTYSILNRKGFVVLTGDAGTGKTTLLTRILQSIPATRAVFSVVLNPTLTPSEFLELALLDFGISDVPDSKAQRLNVLRQFLVEAHQKGQAPVLIVDEAHKLPPDVLEEIRLLSNFEMAESKLLQIVLAGQTELGDLLNREDLRQLKQRVAVRLAIHPLSVSDVEHYIHHRWQKAGAVAPHPFQAEAISHIVRWSRGIPRLVNVLCDNALMLAYGEGLTSVAAMQIAEVAADLDLVERQTRVNGVGGTRAKVAINGNAIAAANGMRSAGGNGVPLPAPVPTLERYQANHAKPSKLMRLAGRLGWANKAAQQL
ncbi:MAG TPA: AAA family ATPase [Bryobacteraceae bacterium]|nr:AAA family ATPase [Bryobacteraceae bacterium]